MYYSEGTADCESEPVVLIGIEFSITIAPQPAGADPGRPDNCERADIADSNKIQGEIATSEDIGPTKIPLDRADYVSIAVTTGTRERQLVIQPPFEPAEDCAEVAKQQGRHKSIHTRAMRDSTPSHQTSTRLSTSLLLRTAESYAFFHRSAGG